MYCEVQCGGAKCSLNGAKCSLTRLDAGVQPGLV
jgi:hypothetical protein